MHEFRTNAGYRALMTASVLSGIGDSLYNIVFIIYASTMPFNTVAVSLASMAGFIPGLFELITGYWADKTPHQPRMMILARVTQALLFGTLALAIMLPHSLALFLGLLLINIVSDICGQYSNGLQLPLLRRLIPTSELNAAMGFQTAAHTTVQMIFQGVGATVIVLLNHNYALFGLLNALTFVLAAVVLWHQRQLLRTVETTTAPPAVPIWHSIGGSLSFVKSEPFLLTLILLTCGINTIGGATDGLMNVSLLHAKALYIGNYGTTIAIISILTSLGLVCGALISKDWFGRLKILTVLGLTTASFIGLAGAFIWGQSRVLLVVAAFAIGYMFGKVNPRISAAMLQLVPEAQLAKVSGLVNLVALIGTPLGQVVFLGVANLATPQLAWWLYGAASFIMVVLTIIVAGRVTAPAAFTTEQNKTATDNQ